MVSARCFRSAKAILSREMRKKQALKIVASQQEQAVANRPNSDPNGTRTRVTAVKGRCPRPLDDGASGTMRYSGVEPKTSSRVRPRILLNHSPKRRPNRE